MLGVLESGDGGVLEEVLDHLEARREVKWEEFSFVEEFISWGSGGFSLIGG